MAILSRTKIVIEKYALGNMAISQPKQPYYGPPKIAMGNMANSHPNSLYYGIEKYTGFAQVDSGFAESGLS